MHTEVMKILEKNDRGYVFYNTETKKSFFSNELVTTLYGNSKGKVDLIKIFPENELNIYLNQIKAALEKEGHTCVYDILTTTANGELKSTDLRLGYINDEKTELFFEFTFKTGERLEITKQYVDSSHKAEFILYFDERLTLYHANQHFYDIFSGTAKDFSSTYNNLLGNIFTYHNQSEVLQHIHEALKVSNNYHEDVEIITPSGETKWFYLDLQRKTLDESGEKLLCFMVCVDNRVEVENKLKSVTTYFDIMQQLSANVLFRIDIESKTLYRNEETAKRYGLPSVVTNFPDSVPDSGVIHPDDISAYMQYGNELLNGVEGSHIARMITPSGAYEYFQFTCKLMRNVHGEAKEIIGKAVNIQKDRDIEERAYYDLLTKTMNKLTFQENAVELLNCSLKDSKHALIFVELDNFRNINKNLGHEFGDFVLQSAAQRLKKMVRDRDLVGRVGGDQFTIFLDSFGDEALLIERGQLFQEMLQKEYSNEAGSLNVCIRVGIALYPKHGTTFKELFRYAETALYTAKQSEKNEVMLYHSSQKSPNTDK